ncbi:PREDICTED: uncharacterized protein LOC105449745 [Wasmannia auropunctata]|uniref:uncharacterized protein LOC105449745 n=1 Tax=Wasmannia auropunctata TaxID=64793 RepID=UPI0005EF03C5|nr:PREDICTED: uncharacterized protein LOC105449745 [Wasmannia auropunctata]
MATTTREDPESGHARDLAAIEIEGFVWWRSCCLSGSRIELTTAPDIAFLPGMSGAAAPSGDGGGGGLAAGSDYPVPHQSVSVSLDCFSQFEGQIAQVQGHTSPPTSNNAISHPHPSLVSLPVITNSDSSTITSASNMSHNASDNVPYNILLNTLPTDAVSSQQQGISHSQDANMNFTPEGDVNAMDIVGQRNSLNKGKANKRAFCALEDSQSSAPATGPGTSTSSSAPSRSPDGKSRRVEERSNVYSNRDRPPYVVHIHALGNNRSNPPHPMRMFAQVGRITPASDIAEMKKLGIDSRSVLTAIASSDYKQGNHIIHRIKQSLITAESEGRNITLCWIPSHKGIPGNERADRLAKLAATNGTRSPFFDIPYTDLQVQAKAHRQVIFKQYLEETFLAKGIQYSELYLNDSPKPWFHNKGLNREEIVCVSRIRSNHYNLNYSLFRKKIIDSPECPCGDTRQDVNHIVFYCQLCIHKSAKLRAFIKKNFPTFMIDLFPMLKDPSPRFCFLYILNFFHSISNAYFI